MDEVKFDKVLKNEEKAAFMLRDLYRSYGFRQYKMSKFEEYDLYADKRDFLASENILSFNDTTGRLMALKPDVTLSIVRNTRDEAGIADRIFYNENVYRAPRAADGFREIMQLGVECIGDISAYNIFETVMLAAKSLALISGDYVLNISHLGIIDRLLDEAGLSYEEKKKAIRLIGMKNMHELKELCVSLSGQLPGRTTDDIVRILSLSGAPGETIPRLRDEQVDTESLSELAALTDMLTKFEPELKIAIDFSVVNDLSYYNGIVLKGYINGVPNAVLSGGQYDPLLGKMGRKSRAIGFGVYMDFLERFGIPGKEYDFDALIVYDDNVDAGALYDAVKGFVARGLSVTAQKTIPDNIHVRAIYFFDEDGVFKRFGSESGKSESGKSESGKSESGKEEAPAPGTSGGGDPL